MNNTHTGSVIESVTGHAPSLGLVEAFEDIVSRPKIKPPVGLLQAINCCACSKDIPWHEWEIRETSAGIKYVYGLHKNRWCRDEKIDLCAEVVCVNCSSMLLIKTNEKPAIDGFVMRRKKVYHIPQCAYCAPSLTQITVIEQEIASKRQKQLTK